MHSLNIHNFRHYGKIVEYPNKSAKGLVRNLWHIVHAETARTGWRAAYLILRDKTIGRLECHPSSDETFVPVKGQALMFVAGEKDIGKIECFLLNKSVIINKGVWHGLVSLTHETEIMIFENSVVSSRYWEFGRRVSRIEDLRKKN